MPSKIPRPALGGAWNLAGSAHSDAYSDRCYLRRMRWPVGYVFTVALVSWCVACALTRWRWAGAFARGPALLVNQSPFITGYFLVASTVLALAEGDVRSPAGAAAAVLALLAIFGLAVVVRQALLAHAALGNPGRPRRRWARILCAPICAAFPSGRPGVVRVRDRAYGDGPRQRLDVYHRRDMPAAATVVHIHGGGFRSGDKAREARPLIRYLTQRGFVCVSVNYRLQPRATLADQVADVRAAIAWIRANIREYGGDPGTLFATGSSAGAYLAIRVAADDGPGLAGLICRYGYYGELAVWPRMPRMLVIHGQNDLLVPAAEAKAFAERARAVSGRAVSYAELPGAHHDFDMFESIRSAAINQAVEAFISDAVDLE
jgi:acetyl esterase/lipase